jgi:hypothetical protein
MDIPYVLPTAPVTPGFMTIYPEPDIYAACCLGKYTASFFYIEYTAPICSGHETRMTTIVCFTYLFSTAVPGM